MQVHVVAAGRKSLQRLSEIKLQIPKEAAQKQDNSLLEAAPTCTFFEAPGSGLGPPQFDVLLSRRELFVEEFSQLS